MENQAELHLCNLVARGYTMSEARAILANRDTTPSPVATVGTVTATPEAGATGGASVPVVVPQSAQQPDPASTPADTGAKPSWMP